MPNRNLKILVSERELHTILAALRTRQSVLCGGTHLLFDDRSIIDDIATNDHQVPSLDADEINDLCEYLNCETEEE